MVKAQRHAYAKFFIVFLILLTSGCFETVDRTDIQGYCPTGKDLAAYVDPMIGTKGAGNSLPSALVPHGMVRVGPDTLNENGKVEAYAYESERIEGFTHTNWQGPGGSGNGYSQILLMPVSQGFSSDVTAWSSSFSHQKETAVPGYYSVELDDPGVLAEVSATSHAAMHRYTFLKPGKGMGIILDLGHSLGESKGGEVRALGSNVLKGYGKYNVHPLIDLLLNRGKGRTGESTVYFYLETDHPFESVSTFKREKDTARLEIGSVYSSGPWIGAFMDFGKTGFNQVNIKIGISLISEEQARKNMEQEIGSKNLDQVADMARARWNCILNRVEVEGGSKEQKTMFYTSLYRSSMQPADYTEAGGVFFSAADQIGDVFKADPGHSFYTDDWCAWDTFRTSRPLATLIEPNRVADVVTSYLHLFEQGGWLPKCPWQAAGYSRVMIGNHGVSIIADALAKGLDSFDHSLAWQALYKEAMEDNEEDHYRGLCGYANLGTTKEYVGKGYVSHECDIAQSASMTLEYAYDDWCTARAAHTLGLDDMEVLFNNRAKNYTNQWNPKTGFMQGRHQDGSFVQPFDPADLGDTNDFCEASSWIYTFFVPHDVQGLAALMGGRKAFLDKLNAFFQSGQFDISNEPSFHIPFFYAQMGKPQETARLVDGILNGSFHAGPDGLPGNDDSGATSAWYVLASMGLYPVAPGDGMYQVSPPSFSSLTIHLDPRVYGNRDFTIRLEQDDSLEPGEIQAYLNHERLKNLQISHFQIIKGGELVIRENYW